MSETLNIKNEPKKKIFLDSKHVSKTKNKFSEFAGKWENYDISLKSIRDKAWKRTITS